MASPLRPPKKRGEGSPPILTVDSLIAKLCILIANSENQAEALACNKALNILLEYQIQTKRF